MVTIKSEIPKEKLYEIFAAMSKVEEKIDDASKILFQLNGNDKTLSEYFYNSTYQNRNK